MAFTSSQLLPLKMPMQRLGTNINVKKQKTLKGFRENLLQGYLNTGIATSFSRLSEAR